MGEAFEHDVEKVSQELRIRPEVYCRILSSFSQTLMVRMQSLKEAVAANDAQTMRVILHEIKGTAGNLRLAQISAAEAVMHEAVHAGEDTAKLTGMFDVLNQQALLLQEWVKQKLTPS
ncbi:MAG: Hpt domain-containing protein [Candidatus Omnitrophota bacterium]|nr:Hpt domain-containing protein [Candidatus Omnitrophota bacterium]MDZ4242279.1 Hpt domain-containing protein [Candidatus Omnitrophota bacterium]